MTSQLFWIALLVFVGGLFVGSNMGVMLMCVLQMSGKEDLPSDDLVPSPLEAEG